MMKSRLLEGKLCLITGCSRGIGKSTLEVFAENGADVFVSFRKYNSEYIDYCNQLSEKNNVNITPLFFEMTDYDQMKEQLKTVMSLKRNVDVLVNNAGILKESVLGMTKIDTIKDVFEVNLFSHLYLIQLVSKIMIKHKSGSIINVSSVAAIDPSAGQVAYSGSKAALISATKALSKELAPFGIRVNAVAPGYTNTDLIAGTKELIESKLSAVTLKRYASPEEIAKSILFLSSELSSYITGQVIRVDGGM